MKTSLLIVIGVLLGIAPSNSWAGLIAHYEFEGNFDDSSGSGYHGTALGRAEIIQDPGGNGKPASMALFQDAFDSDGGGVDIGNFNPSEGTGQMTVAAWIQLVDDAHQWPYMGVVSKSTAWRDADTMWQMHIDQVDSPNEQFILRARVAGQSTHQAPYDAAFGETIPHDEWHHVAWTHDQETTLAQFFIDGMQVGDDLPFEVGVDTEADMHIGYVRRDNNSPDTPIELFSGMIDDVRIYDEVLDESAIQAIMAGTDLATRLQAGDADQDLDFDQLDLVRVQVAAKYLTGQTATWGEGDWNGAPGGMPDSPPPGDGVFDQLDIISALAPGHYLQGPYAAIRPDGVANDAQASIAYNATTGEVAVDAPSGMELTSINIDSASGVFTAEAAQNLGGSFDNDADNNIFKATFGGSFGSLSFGNVAQTGLSKDFVANDLSVVGSLAGGGALGVVDLIYVPEPTSALLSAIGLMAVLCMRRR